MKYLNQLLTLFLLFAFSESLMSQCNTGEIEVQVQIVPDGFPNEISWDIQDSLGNVIYESALGSDFNYTGCVPDGQCLVFTIYDTFGDGLLGEANYMVYMGTELVANGGGNYGHEESTAINCADNPGNPPTIDCTNPNTISFEVMINPDEYPGEITWDLKDANGQIIHQSSGSGQDFVYSDCIILDGCMTFTIYDSYGDGMLGNANYTVLVAGQEVASGGGNYGYSESTNFNCAPGSTCSDGFPLAEGNQASDAGNVWYIFMPTQTGMYEFNTCNGNTCGGSTIWVYDYCSGLDWDDTNAGTIYYSDDGCGSTDFAYLNVPFGAGQTYYVRIKYDNAACSNEQMNWTLTYGGPVSGCTDEMACNFSPLATSDDGSCIYPGDPNCPDGPDLIIVDDVLVSSMYVTTLTNNDACLIEEGCVSGYGQRDIIRFTTHIKNIGNADYYIGAPQANDQWEWDPCHNHWHYEGYAEYVLYDMDDGTELPIGFKNGFCVMDLECSDGGDAKYGCGDQGISKQCGDIYDSGLECQWIDITDVEDGDYMFVVRVNWDQSPDVLGRIEMDYENNWSQVCLNISRDPVSNEPTFTFLEECAPYEDCLGVLYGDAQPDCEGICAGVALQGDINADTARTVSDLTLYMLESLLDTITPTPCNDLNADGEVTVMDATLLYDCVLHGTGSLPPDHQHTPCEYPHSIVNPNDKAVLTLSEINDEEGYVEVQIKNTSGKILSFEFDMSGLVISHITNHIPNYYPNILHDNNEIIGVSYDESYIDKNADYVPFLRVYYSATTDEQICIANITDFVNDDHEEMMKEIDEACLDVPQATAVLDLSLNPFGAKVVPNPSTNRAILSFASVKNQSMTLEILDVSGKEIYTQNDVDDNEIILPVSTFGAGMYIYRLSDGEQVSIGRFVVE